MLENAFLSIRKDKYQGYVVMLILKKNFKRDIIKKIKIFLLHSFGIYIFNLEAVPEIQKIIIFLFI